jgi:thioredoxin reductase (NADPH)
MSEYLIKEITSTPSIAVRHNAVVTGGTGTSSLESLTVQDEASGAIEIVPAAALFVLIGAEPPHSVAARDIERDRWEFVVHGGRPPGGRPPSGELAAPASESSLPGLRGRRRPQRIGASR